MKETISRTTRRSLSGLAMPALLLSIASVAGFAIIASAATAPTTQPATGITSTDATLNGTNGDTAAAGHSFWASTSTFTPTVNPLVVPPGVHDTGDLGPVAANAPMSTALTTTGIPVTPNTTYYFTAFSNGGGDWTPGSVLSFTTAPAGPVFIDSNTNGTLDPGEQTFPTIQAAVDAANSGDTIVAGPGTYDEHVSVNKSVTINGANVGVAGNGTRSAESIVDGQDTGTPFAITANNVTINGFTVTNGSNGGFDAGIWSQTGTQNSTVENNIVTGNAFGIWAQCGGTCLIQNNLFNGNNKAGTGSGSASISADSTTGLTINNNEFENDTAGNPILLQATAAGAHSNIVISDNTFHDNTNSNIYALAINGGTIDGNTITPQSDATGISLSGADVNVTITNNTISGGARGVRVEDAGYGLGDNSAITVNNNDVSSDTTYGVGNTDTSIASLDATCNWWGAANGPGPIASGSGSPVTSMIDYSSWLTSSSLSGDCNGTTTPATFVTTNAATGVTSSDATLNGTNGSSDAIGHSFWVSTSTFSTASPTIPSGVYSTPDMGAIAANATFSATLSSITADGVPGNLPPVTPNTTYYFAAWSNVGGTWHPGTILNFTTTGTTTPPSSPEVHIFKYIDGVQATATNAASSSFPMETTFNSPNLGTATAAPFTLSPTGWGPTDSAYEASFVGSNAGADYEADEVLSGNVVAASCSAGKPFALVGYTTGDTLQEAQQGTPSLTAPAFTNLQSDKYVIVWNHDCSQVTPPSTVKVTIVKFIDGQHATASNASSSTFPFIADYNATSSGNHIQGSDPFSVGPTGNNTPNAYEAQTLDFAPGADYSAHEVTGGTVVGADCSTNDPFSLMGYSSGDTLAAAETAATSTTAPAFTNLQSDKYVVVWNHDCSQTGGGIGGNVGGNGVLHVDSIDAVQTSATADNNYADGWKYVFHITAPTNEPNLSMKFSDWLSGANIIPVANNMRIFSPQSSNATNEASAVTLTAANTYSSPLDMVWDNATSTPDGRQVDVTVEVKIPNGTQNGSYTTNYGVQTLP